MTDTLAPAVPAGWYDDPSNPYAVRWWSGAEWTTHTAPKPQAAVAVAAPTGEVSPFADATPYSFSRDPSLNGRTASISHEVAERPKGSPQTVGIWLLSFLPLMTLALSVLSALLLTLSGVPLLAYTGAVISIGLVFFFAVLDARSLESRGYRSTSPLWMLLVPPLVYLIIRGRSVRKQGGRAWPSELVYLANFCVIIAVAFWMAYGPLGPGAPGVTGPGTGSTPTQEGELYFAGTIEDEPVVEAWGVEYLIAMTMDPAGSVTVDCAESEAIMDFGMPIRCTAVDATGVSALINGEVTAEGEVWFSYRILAPESELHGTGNGIITAQELTAGSIGDERLPWQSQIEDGLATWGGYHGPGGVDCSDAAGVIDHSSTFDCFAAKSVDEIVRLNVTITEIGNIEYTEYPIDESDLPEPSQGA